MNKSKKYLIKAIANTVLALRFERISAKRSQSHLETWVTHNKIPYIFLLIGSFFFGWEFAKRKLLYQATKHLTKQSLKAFSEGAISQVQSHILINIIRKVISLIPH